MTTDLRLGDGKPKPSGTWDYYGSLDPAHHRGTWSMLTFSVGVFQWVAKGRGKVAKRAGAVKRFSGPVAVPDEVHKKALAFIAAQSGAETAPLSSDTPERSSEDVQHAQSVPRHPEHESACRAPEHRLALTTCTPAGDHLVHRSAYNQQRDEEIGQVPADGIRAAATRLNEGVQQARYDGAPEGRDSRQHVRSIEAAPADRCPE